MKIYLKLAVFILLILPGVSSAIVCLDDVTVVYVNGMFAESEKYVEEDSKLLRKKFADEHSLNGVYFTYAFNPSRFGGLGEGWKVIAQTFMPGNYIRDYDFHTIVNKLNKEVATKRVLLVGHSQGTFYTNLLYQYYIENGVPPESIGVFNIATPASFVAGDGTYLTSESDNVINTARETQYNSGFPVALPANTNIGSMPGDEASGIFFGHNLRKVYIPGLPKKIASEINEHAQKLRAASADYYPCLPANDRRLTHIGQSFGLQTVRVLSGEAIRPTAQYAAERIADAYEIAGSSLLTVSNATLDMTTYAAHRGADQLIAVGNTTISAAQFTYNTSRAIVGASMNLASSVLFSTPVQAQSSTAVLAVVPSITTPETELYHPVTFEPLPKVQPEVVPPQPVLSEEPITWKYIPERDASYIPVVAAPHTVVSTPVTGSAPGGSDIPSTPALPQPIILTGGAGQGGGGSPVSEVVATASAPVVAPLVCTLPEVPSVDGTVCVTPDIVCTPPEVRDTATNTCTTPDTTPPSLTLHLAGCLSLQSTETTYTCVAHTDGSITASWEVEPGSTVSLDTVVTTETSSTLSGNATFVAADVAGNTTTKQVIISRSGAPLFISEVGYPLSSHLLPPGVLLSHQYVELYNPTDVPIDLTSLLLESSSQSSAGTPQFSLALSGTIQPQQYFLITNALDIDGVTEDVMHAWTNTIPNSGTEAHQLLLKQGTITLDSFELGCPALSSVCHISGHPFALERSRRQNSSVSYAYADEQGNPRFVYTAGTKQFVGSPGKRNTADYVLAALTGVLSTEFSPYYGRTVVVPAGSTATIEAGATLTMSDGGGFGVNGILNIRGTTSSPVTISSAERWYGISVAATGALIAEHTQIARAGAGNSGSDRAALTNEGGSITLTDVTLTDVRPNGFFQESGMSTFTNVSFQNSDYPENAVKVRGGSFTYTGGTLTNFSDFGFHLTGTPACAITDVTIIGVRTARTNGSEIICGWSGVMFNGSPL